MSTRPHPQTLKNLPKIHMDDVNDYVSYGERLGVELGLVHSKGRFDWTGQFTRLDGFGLSVGHWGTEVTLRGDVTNYLVSFPLRGRAMVTGCGRADHRQRAVLLGVRSPEVEIAIEPGFSTIVLTFEQAHLRDHLATVLGLERVDLSLDVDIDLRSGSGLYLQRMAEFMARTAGSRPPDDAAGARAFAGMRENFVHALLASQLRSGAFEQPAPDVGERRVRLLEGYIEEHLDAPLTLTELARRAGVSGRAVQMAFQRYRGVSPSAFIRERRLLRAARLLRTADRSVTVLDVALDSGFAHTGRFARCYRERFGEPPSATLRNSRRKNSASSARRGHLLGPTE